MIENRKYLLELLGTVTMLLSDILIYGFLITEVSNSISFANITIYFLTVNMLMQSLKEVTRDFSILYGEGLFVVDFFRFINADLCEYKKNIGNIRKSVTAGIEIKDLNFKYPKTDNYIIKGVNLSISPGERIAIVGDNGVGKTTFVKILIGLFRDFEGDISIDNLSIREMSNTELFGLFSVVFQDINILDFTICENIMGKVDEEGRQKVWEVLEKVGLYNKISKLPKGIDSLVHKRIEEEGVEFSGGEYQKMALARALYKEAKILILDEPTAALDPLAEKEIYEKFNDMTQGKTTLFISHIVENSLII